MFYQRKKVIMFFANVAFIFTSMLPNSVTMGMEPDTSASSSSSSGSLINNANGSGSESDTSSNLSDVQTVNDINGSAQCCDRCCGDFCSCFCDDLVQNHPCAAASCFLSLGIATVVLMAEVMSSNQ